jgi:hypothetical protein
LSQGIFLILKSQILEKSKNHLAILHSWGQFLTTWFAPRCELGPQWSTLSPRGNDVPPFVHPQGWWTLFTI